MLPSCQGILDGRCIAPPGTHHSLQPPTHEESSLLSLSLSLPLPCRCTFNSIAHLSLHQQHGRMSSFLHPRSTLLIILSILLLLTTSTLPVRAHSNLGYPLAYSKVACKGKRRWCQGACPPVWKGLARNSPRKPAAVWRRGQRVRIVWHKNNHIDGFYRY